MISDVGFNILVCFSMLIFKKIKGAGKQTPDFPLDADGAHEESCSCPFLKRMRILLNDLSLLFSIFGCLVIDVKMSIRLQSLCTIWKADRRPTYCLLIVAWYLDVGLWGSRSDLQAFWSREHGLRR
jgi:hypothetical protein